MSCRVGPPTWRCSTAAIILGSAGVAASEPLFRGIAGKCQDELTTSELQCQHEIVVVPVAKEAVELRIVEVLGEFIECGVYKC